MVACTPTTPLQLRFTVFDGSMLKVELRRQEVCDADLPSLFRHVGFRLQTAGPQSGFALDLSDNSQITDYGVTMHIVHFLRQWPQCSSLKLARTSIGDASLKALSEWMSSSTVVEVDLSQLGGSITSQVAIDTLQRIISRRKAQQKDRREADGKLWFCLELNGLEGVEAAVSHANIWERSCAGWKRQSTCKANKIPVVELALFPSHPGASLSNRGREILSILQANSTAKKSTGTGEPVALSVDEFKLYCMESREAAEVGADQKNHETFGKDAISEGWSFERNIEANLLLKSAINSRSFSAPDVPLVQPKQIPKELHKRDKTAKKDKKEKKEKHEKRADSPQNAAKSVVDKTVRFLLKDTGVLHASDFRGNVREWLLEIHRKGGGKGVAEAAELIRVTVASKQRGDVAKWTGYLCKLLERFHAQIRTPTQVQLQ